MAPNVAPSPPPGGVLPRRPPALAPVPGGRTPRPLVAEPSEFDRLVARAAERLRPALGPHAAQAVARDIVLDAVRFALQWAGT